METLIHQVVYVYPYPIVYILTWGYFFLLYFVVGFIFLSTCRFLAKQGWVHSITQGATQTHYEIEQSLQSIIIFGFSGIPIMFLIRSGAIAVSENSVLNITVGLLILNLWNEVHFFMVHRLMHTRFLMKHVHYVHHRSKVPTVYAVYSFHWFEALLLSTVPLTIAPFVPLAPLAFLLYPLCSILLNFAGHCNYRFGKGEGKRWYCFATGHTQHHRKGSKNYGFLLPFFDKLFKTQA
jgi:lathosterol oxidase